jgi:hypothetical protein
VGDWVWHDDILTIYVSEMKKWEHMALVAIHELAEAVLCKKRDISDQVVDQFDQQGCKECGCNMVDEPGADPHAPYRREHFTASMIESAMACELGVNWAAYDKAVMAL